MPTSITVEQIKNAESCGAMLSMLHIAQGELDVWVFDIGCITPDDYGLAELKEALDELDASASDEDDEDYTESRRDLERLLYAAIEVWD